MKKIVTMFLSIVIALICCLNLMACDVVDFPLPNTGNNSGLEDGNGSGDKNDNNESVPEDNLPNDNDDNDVDGTPGDNDDDITVEIPLTQEQMNEKSQTAISNATMALALPIVANGEGKLIGSFSSTINDSKTTLKTKVDYKVHFKNKDNATNSLSSGNVNLNNYDFAFDVDASINGKNISIVLPHENSDSRIGYLNVDGNKVKLEYAKILDFISSDKESLEIESQNNNFMAQIQKLISEDVGFLFSSICNYKYSEIGNKITIITSIIKDSVTAEVTIIINKLSETAFAFESIQIVSTDNNVKTTLIITIANGSFDIEMPEDEKSYFNIADIDKAVNDMKEIALAYNYVVSVGDTNEITGTYLEFIESSEPLVKQFNLSNISNNINNSFIHILNPYEETKLFHYVEDSVLMESYTYEEVNVCKMEIMSEFLGVNDEIVGIFNELLLKQFMPVNFTTSGSALTITLVSNSLKIDITVAIKVNEDGRYYFDKFVISISDSLNKPIYSFDATFDLSLTDGSSGFDYLFNS